MGHKMIVTFAEDAYGKYLCKLQPQTKNLFSSKSSKKLNIFCFSNSKPPFTKINSISYQVSFF